MAANPQNGNSRKRVQTRQNGVPDRAADILVTPRTTSRVRAPSPTAPSGEGGAASAAAHPHLEHIERGEHVRRPTTQHDRVTGKVIGSCLPRHRHTEFLRFLKIIDAEVPTGLEVHLILDNYATRKHANVVAWLAKHPRFRLHFTPTSSSWLNLVERWFRELTDKALRRGVFHSVPDLITAIEAYLTAHNDEPKPFIWTAPADDILAKVARGRVTLANAG